MIRLDNILLYTPPSRPRDTMIDFKEYLTIFRFVTVEKKKKNGSYGAITCPQYDSITHFLTFLHHCCEYV